MMFRSWASFAAGLALLASPEVAAQSSTIRVVPTSPSAPSRSSPAAPAATPPAGAAPGGQRTLRPRAAAARSLPLPSQLPLTVAHTPEPPSFPTAPVVLLSTSAVLAVVGAVFAGEAVSALNEQDAQLRASSDRMELTDEFRSTQERVVVSTILSTALLSTAASSALLGTVLLAEN